MTYRSLIAVVIQLIGVYLACNVLASGMSITLFGGAGDGGMSADWARIWWFNISFWVAGLGMSMCLIFLARPIASLICRLAGANESAELIKVGLTSEVIVQIFAVFLLIRQAHVVAHDLIWLLQSPGFQVTRMIVLIVYYGATIGVAIWLLRCPEALTRFRNSPPKNKKGEQGGDGDAEEAV